MNKSESVPRVGEVDWGDLRRLRPISDVFGQDRGTTIRRYYIDKFLKDIGLRKKIVVDMTHTENRNDIGPIHTDSLSNSQLRLKILEKKLKELENNKK